MNSYGYFTLKSSTYLSNQRIAGKVLNKALSTIKSNIKPGVTTQELNNIGQEVILSNNLTPTFLGYKGFPSAFCISINKTIVHGIPNDYALQEGDVVKIDGGVTCEGAIADAAFTTICGKPKDVRAKFIVEDCSKILKKVIAFIVPGKTTVGDIGFFIKKECSNLGHNVVKNLTGHGLEIDTPHWAPIMMNEGTRGDGPVIIDGMTFCLEPMIVDGVGDITIDKNDGWSVYTKSIGAHFESTLFVVDGKVEDIVGII